MWYNAHMYGLPISYNPFGPHAQPAIPIPNLEAAKNVPDATHISLDGLCVYTNNGKRVYYWDDESKTFGSSFPCDGLPTNVVVVYE